MNHLFLRVRGSNILLKILARIIQLLLKAKTKRACLSWLPNRLAKLWVNILFSPPSLIIIYFTTYRPFHWLAWNVKCMDNDARMQIEMMSWMQSNKQENNQYRYKCENRPCYCFLKVGFSFFEDKDIACPKGWKVILLRSKRNVSENITALRSVWMNGASKR